MQSASPIKHVFVLTLENHSFDNVLALSGIPGILAATTNDSNTYKGVTYFVRGNAPGGMPSDPGHEFLDVVEQLGGEGVRYTAGKYPAINNSGFAANYAVTTTEGPAAPAADIGEIMLCFDTASQLPATYQLATNFVVCDQWFSSLPGPTWPNRFFLHGASSNGLDHTPSKEEMDEWVAVDGFKYPNGSIFDAMNANNVTWRLYRDTSGPIEGSIPQVASIHNIELWDVHDISEFQSDVQSGSYDYQYTFIEPNYGDVVSTYEGGSSQHPMDGVANGERLIAQVYESIRNAPLWDSSMLIVTYDEHGGFYDHFAPGAAQPPDDGGDSSGYSEYDFTFAQYGVRVPAMIVSPWVAAAVDHTVYDHTSILATLESLFGVPHLTKRDAQANTFNGVILSVMRTDCPTKLNVPPPEPAARVLSAAALAARELEPVPERSSLVGFLGTVYKADRKLASTPAGKAAAAAKFKSIRTRGEARAYIREVMAKVQAAKAARGR